MPEDQPQRPHNDDAPPEEPRFWQPKRRADPDENIMPPSAKTNHGRRRNYSDTDAHQPVKRDSVPSTPQQQQPAPVQPTRVTTRQPQYEQPGQLRPVQPPMPKPASEPQRAQPPKQSGGWLRFLTRLMLATILLAIVASLLAIVSSVGSYVYIANQLPPADELKQRQFQFRTSGIYDRDGNLLWEITDPNFGRRTDVALANIAPDLRQATIATEDRNFYVNVGVDPIAVARAVYYNVTEGSIVSGGSTITQQLVKNTLLTEQERTERSLIRKVKEAVLAVEVNRSYDKNDILEIYLNQIYYGNLAYGIEAASQTYFGKHANQLTLAEAALLAGLPQSPAVHDPYTNPDGAKKRQAVVLSLMIEDGYITPSEALAATSEPVIDSLKDLSREFEAPHFVSLVRAELETVLPPEFIYQAGLRIETTLDKQLQDMAEEVVAKHVDALADRNVTNGALVAINPANGEVMAMVGSKDFRNEAIAGQINMAVTPRQPGSSIKPLVYLAAFEKGWTPSTLIMDVPVEYPDGAGGVYAPNNYDEKFHGPTLVRAAIANSYNIPAVKALEFVGLAEMKAMAARMGITSLTRDDYGLALALGGGEVPLIEMAGAYQVLANGGTRIKPHTIVRVQDHFGNDVPIVRDEPQRAISEQHAFLMTSILSDNNARTPSFGANNLLKLSRPVAAKTGTTNDFRDNLVLGYTPDIVAGVWVGNADYTPMQGTTGLSGAGPIWHEFMERAHEALPVRSFTPPEGVVEIEVCADSGTLPSERCPQRRVEIFAENQPPLGPEHDIHQMIDIDLNTNTRANEFCRSRVEARYYQVFPVDGREWAEKNGIPQPPEEFCPSSAISARITSPADGDTVRGVIGIQGQALAANFSYYEIEYGVGTGPQAFAKVTSPQNRLIEGGQLATFDTTQYDNGPYTLRLMVYDQSGGGMEDRVRILIDNLPTPMPTATETPIPTATMTPSPTYTPVPDEPSPTPVPPTATPLPTNTPLPADTATPVPPTPPEVIKPTELPTEAPVEAEPPPTETPVSDIAPPPEEPANPGG